MDQHLSGDFELGQFPWVEPKLSKPADNELSKQWAVVYGLWSYDKKAVVRKRVIITGETVELRLANARKVMLDLKQYADRA